MEILALGIAFLALIVVVAVSARLRHPTRRPPGRLEADPAGTLEERVEKLERLFPEWLVTMEGFADQCADMLGSAERKRRRAAMSERRATGAVAAEDGPGGREGGIPMDDAAMRSAVLAESRRRRGMM
jgi:hypothetical protein